MGREEFDIEEEIAFRERQLEDHLESLDERDTI